MKKVFVTLSSLLLVACTKAGLELANLPNKFSDTQTIKNIDYGPQPWQKLDLYIPPNPSHEPLPVVVFFYGGSWKEGSKSMYPFVGEAFAKKGYITVIADYSKYPQVTFPAFVEDGAKAVAWTYRHVAQYGGNPSELFIVGHSAGAHIGALITADSHYLSAEGENRSIIKAFAGLSGPYDFVPYEKDYIAIFGPPENYPKMQVPTFIDGKEPPMLLLWGADDDVVGKSNMDKLVAKIHEKGGVEEHKTYAGVDHVGMVSTFIWFLNSKAPILDDITAFFSQYK
ncbi:Carboxylesterase NlhH [Marinomonas spartinae]|uniref:Carboxylesterase NlhH n=1 Tax=Marinomonas spartinae TaxID=1792290 RepID=A0A1A8TEY7_9GAMM|nr:alpha/beta hydrolase [Marinomonas spartinae]SBS31014.1 Carboxylesterase NlhH [Marinomonas spartinae]SBS33169.1 Carboxylesterase NlhH [Marinomonas spartinae]